MSVEVKSAGRTGFESGPWRHRKGSGGGGGRRSSSGGRGGGAAGGGGGRAGGATGHHHHHHHHRSHSSGGRGYKHNDRQPAAGRINRKRRYSDRAPGEGHGHPFKRRFGRWGRHEKIVLPTKFLLGGNINDPLNLNSLCDEEINRALNEKTPVSSPLPLPPHKGEVKVLIPPNIRDPLGLDSECDPSLISPNVPEVKKRKHKRKNLAHLAISPIVHLDDSPRTSTTTTVSGLARKDQGRTNAPRPTHIDIGPHINTSVGGAKFSASAEAAANKKIQDKIVSPVIPQTSPKKRKRKSSEGLSDNAARAQVRDGGGDKPIKSDKTSPHRPKFRKQGSNQSQQGSHKQHRRGSGGNKQDKFIYGNYNRYYGFRNPGQQEDERLKIFKEEWFHNLDVLDIGCNVGHVTLSIGQKFAPRSIVGIDVDPALIGAARKNVRHYVSMDTAKSKNFPLSMQTCFGPLVAPTIPSVNTNVFPNNVSFVTGDYVPEKDELVELQKEEYDVILVLSVTKWIHLHHGDAGLKRVFKRIMNALRPGGRLILEPQGWASYKRKKNLTEKIAENYRKIRFRPDQFTEYLLSREVGFSKCETLTLPHKKGKTNTFGSAFQRPIQVFTKPETATVTPQWSWNTPNRSLAGSGPNTPWWESIELQPAGSPLVDTPIARVSPLVEIRSPTGESPAMATADENIDVDPIDPGARSPSPLLENMKSKLTPARSQETICTSGFGSPAAQFDLGGGGDSVPPTPTKVKFMIGGSSGFCTPCDSPQYTQLGQRAYSKTDHDVVMTTEMTPKRQDSGASLLRVQSAPGLLETAPFRLKRDKVLHIGTAPGLLETSFGTSESCDDSECCAFCDCSSCKSNADAEGDSGAHVETREHCENGTQFETRGQCSNAYAHRTVGAGYVGGSTAEDDVWVQTPEDQLASETLWQDRDGEASRTGNANEISDVAETTVGDKEMEEPTEKREENFENEAVPKLPRDQDGSTNQSESPT